MTENNPNFKKILFEGHFEPPSFNNNPERCGTEEEKKENNSNDLSAEKAHMVANFLSMKERILKEVRDNSGLSSRLDLSFVSMDPHSMNIEDLRGTLSSMSSMVNIVVVAEESIDGDSSLAQSLVDKCKGLFKKKHCHDHHDKPSFLGGVLKEVAMKELGTFHPLPGEVVPVGFVTDKNKIDIMEVHSRGRSLV